MCDLNKPLITATLGDFIEALRETGLFEQGLPDKDEFCYGYSGVMELFHCSKSTAQRMVTSGQLGSALYRFGNKIVVNKRAALKACRSRF